MQKILFFVQTQPGIEKITQLEIKEKLPEAEIVELKTIGERNGIVIFHYPGDLEDIFFLRSIEDVFVMVDHQKDISEGKVGLRQIREIVKKGKNFELALSIHKKIFPKKKGKTTFRVITRKYGKHSFRRKDMQKAVERRILERYNRKWRLVEDDSDLEFWATLLGKEFIFGLRISDKTLKQRPYKIKHLPASLRPSVAFAMVFLSRPNSNDVFLDPMCGAGTILIERALSGRYKLLLGGGIDPKAIEVALENIGPKYRPIKVKLWDTTALPLEACSIDKIVTNLPFGKRIGSHQDNKILYEKFFKEFKRVVKPGGRMVLLTSEQRIMEDLLKEFPEYNLKNTYDILILGQPARIYISDTSRVSD